MSQENIVEVYMRR